jgi:hypothetical protein
MDKAMWSLADLTWLTLPKLFHGMFSRRTLADPGEKRGWGWRGRKCSQKFFEKLLHGRARKWTTPGK